MTEKLSKCCRVTESAFGTCRNCGLPFEERDCYYPNCIECGKKVSENNSAKNCHDNCRLEL